MYHYTDPDRASVLDAFSIAAAHAESTEAQIDEQQEVTQMTDYMTGLFGLFSDVLTEPAPGFDPPAGRIVAAQETSTMQTRTDQLRGEIWQKCQTQPSKTHAKRTASTWKILQAVFTPNNFSQFIAAHFSTFHPQHPLVHRPTFDSDSVSLPLLLAVAMAGSVHCAPNDDVLAAPLFFDVAEDYIFESLQKLQVSNSSFDDRETQILQAALLIIALQVSVNNDEVHRRIRVVRWPELVKEPSV